MDEHTGGDSNSSSTDHARSDVHANTTTCNIQCLLETVGRDLMQHLVSAGPSRAPVSNLLCADESGAVPSDEEEECACLFFCDQLTVTCEMCLQACCRVSSCQIVCCSQVPARGAMVRVNSSLRQTATELSPTHQTSLHRHRSCLCAHTQCTLLPPLEKLA